MFLNGQSFSLGCHIHNGTYIYNANHDTNNNTNYTNPTRYRPTVVNITSYT